MTRKDRAYIFGCDVDGFGNVLFLGEPTVCLCCSTPSYATLLNPEYGGDDGHGYPGSKWILQSKAPTEIAMRADERRRKWRARA